MYDGLSRKRSVWEQTWVPESTVNGVTTPAAWRTDKLRQLVYDGLDVIREIETNYNTDGTVSSTRTIKLTRDGNIGGILNRTTVSGTTSTHLFYHYDGSGNVAQLTNASQSSVAEYSYDAYGVTLTSTGTEAASNPYRSQSKEYQGLSGLYDFGYRYYSPSLGRWINRDPIGESR